MSLLKTCAAFLLTSMTLASAASNPPACTAAYGKLNNTIQVGAINIEQSNGQNGAAMGMYSIRIGDYSGFGEAIKDNLPDITRATQAFVPLLRQATIKCNTCAKPDGSLNYAHPYRKPVVQYDDIENIFAVGHNIISGSLSYKYCDNPTAGVCRDSPSYCPEGNEAPDASVKPLIRQYIRTNLAAFGTGPTSVKGSLPALQKGAIYPYYDCLAAYAKPAVVQAFEEKWFTFMRNLVALNATECV